MIIVVLAFALTSIYGFINMKDAYYSVIKTALQITDAELGRMWSVYGIVATLSYPIGGYLADRFPPQKLLMTALIGSAILHVMLSFVRIYAILLVISGLLGVMAILIYFPASSKIITYLGNAETAGGIVGNYYATGAVLGVILSVVVGTFYAHHPDERTLFVLMMRYFAVLSIIGAVGVRNLFKNQVISGDSAGRIELGQVRSALRMKEVWLLAGTMVCSYALFCFTAYMTPYLTNKFEITGQVTLYIGLIRGTASYITATALFGRFADMAKSSMTVVKRALFAAGILLILLGITSVHAKSIAAAIGLTAVFAFFVIGAKTIGLAMVPEIGFPYQIVGTVIGIISFIGYSPDAYVYQITGSVIQAQGERAFTILFAAGAVIAFAGAACCRQLIIENRNIKLREQESQELL